MPQKLFKITQVSFYKRQKEDREIFIIGLNFHPKINFFFFLNKVKKEQYGDIHQWEN